MQFKTILVPYDFSPYAVWAVLSSFIAYLDDLLMLLSEEMADMGKGISGALFRSPSPSGPAETVMPMDWLMSYL